MQPKMQKQRKKMQKERKKKRKRRRNGDQLKPTQAAPDPGRRHRLRAIDPGRTATQVARRNQVAARLFLVFFFFFFFLLWWTPFSLGFFFLSSLMNTLVLPLWFFFVFFLNVNRVLETRFSYRCHVEKVSHRTWTTHKNRALKARFRAQNRAFEARVAKNPYSL